MSIKEYRIKIGNDGNVEEVTTRVDQGDNQPSAGEKIMYMVVGVPVAIYFLLRWIFG